MAEKKKIKLGWLRSLAINIAFGILSEVSNAIDDELWRDWSKSHIEPLRELVDVLTDKDPQNKTQLIELLQRHGKSWAIDQLKFVKGVVSRYAKNETTKALIVSTVEMLIKEVEDLELKIG